MRKPLTIALLFTAILAASPDVQAQGPSAAGMLESFFEALNSDDPGAMAEFVKENATESFRSRKTAEEDAALWERIRSELGRLTVRGMRRASPAKALVSLSAENTPMPVEFGFDLVDGKIDGFSVNVGGPPGGREPMVELPEQAEDEALFAALDRQLRELAAKDRFSGVVLVAREGAPVFHRGYGLADRDGGRAVEPTTRFDVGSITKLLTKIAIAQLAQTGKLELDDTLFARLPSYPNPEIAKRITLRQILDHSSGLGDIFNEGWAAADKSRFIQPADFLPLFADEPLQFEPGSRRSYSNAGYITLGAVVAAVSGEPYFEYVDAHVLRSAGISASGFPVKDGSDPTLAIGFTRGGPTGGRTDATGPLEPNLGMLPIRGCPAGSSSHTAEDLLKLDRALRQGKLLDPEWTEWVFGGGFDGDASSATIGIAGGGPGVSAGWESDGAVTAIVLANLDPPAGEGLAMELYQALAR